MIELGVACLCLLLATSCEEMEPTYRLSRGKSVYDSWMLVTKDILAQRQACVYMNQLSIWKRIWVEGEPTNFIKSNRTLYTHT